VAALVAAAGPGDPEAVAADISILVQAARATAALIEGRDPPVPSTRRIGPDGEVELDLTGLPFGAGRHACPGERHARAPGRAEDVRPGRLQEARAIRGARSAGPPGG
jgi:hypothetical protein